MPLLIKRQWIRNVSEDKVSGLPVSGGSLFQVEGTANAKASRQVAQCIQGTVNSSWWLAWIQRDGKSPKATVSTLSVTRVRRQGIGQVQKCKRFISVTHPSLWLTNSSLLHSRWQWVARNCWSPGFCEANKHWALSPNPRSFWPCPVQSHGGGLGLALPTA